MRALLPGVSRRWLVSVAALVGCFAAPPTALAAPLWNIEPQARPTAFQTADTSAQTQILEVAVNGGAGYSLTFEGQTTSVLSPNSSDAEAIESALDGLSTIAGQGMTVTVTAVEVVSLQYPQRYTVTFAGGSSAGGVPLIEVVGSSATVARSTNDAYDIHIQNLGATTSSGAITVEDRLPAGVTTTDTPHEQEPSGHDWSCSAGAGQSVVRCESTSAVAPASAAYDLGPITSTSHIDSIVIPVTVASATSGMLTNTVTVSGGGAPAAVSSGNPNPVNAGTETSFGPSLVSLLVVGADGSAFTHAGGHPYAVTADLDPKLEVPPGTTDAADEQRKYMNVAGGDEVRTVVAELPLGLIGDPQATPRCSMAQFTESGENKNLCPANTRVGVVTLGKEEGLGDGPYQLFNLAPEAGHAAEFGLSAQSFAIVLYGDVVHSARGYVLRVTALPIEAQLHGFSVTFFGDPAAVFATGGKETPFLTNPVDCAAGEAARTLMVHIDSWGHPGAGDPFDGDFSDPNWAAAGTTLPPVEECGALTFNPSLSLAPISAAEGGTTQADEPSGYDVNLQVPETETYSELATPELKTATVTLPEGLSVSPSAANGLQACSDAQIALQSNEPGSCPLASQIGTVKVTTPLLEAPLEGQVFLGEPECSPCGESDAGDGHLFRLFIQVHSEARGITIKLPGVVKANPQTGRLTAEFAENPQLPFSDLELKFKSGPRAPLANPQTCGTFTTVSDLEPWSAPQTPTEVSQSSFAITGCGSSMPFAPAFTAGMVYPAAGAYSPFSATFSRSDGEQDLGAITVQTPPGLLGKIAGIPRCGEAEANAGTCGPESQIGTTTATAGPGSAPYTISGGRVYLTGPYEGQPFGLSIVVPAVAGPFNLGDVVVRASIAVNPATSALTITSDPLPQIRDGVPFRLRTVTVEVNRPGFMFNATNCSAQAISATITGEHAIGSSEAAKSSVASSAYAASGCANLPFKPKLTAVTAGQASKAGGASLDVKIESAGLGQANIAKVDLQLPVALPSRLSTLQKACLAAVFNANPAACEEDSVIGKATIHTPILNAPLTGPAYLVSHGGAAFPDVEFVLQGEGVTLILDGKTDIKNGITYSRFESTPDAPFTTFETELPTGPHSILAAYLPASANYNLCGTSLAMPTEITAQNGAVIKQSTNVAITGCPPALTITRTKVKGNTVLVTVKVGEAGTVKITGRGLRTTTKKGVKAGTHTITVPLTNIGRAAKKHKRKLKIKATLTVAGRTGTATTTLKA
jgi:hypothetical protein